MALEFDITLTLDEEELKDLAALMQFRYISSRPGAQDLYDKIFDLLKQHTKLESWQLAVGRVEGIDHDKNLAHEADMMAENNIPF